MFLEPGVAGLARYIAYSGLGGLGGSGLVVGLLAAAGTTTAAGTGVAEGGDGEGGNDEDELLHSEFCWVVMIPDDPHRACRRDPSDAKHGKRFRLLQIPRAIGGKTPATQPG